MKHSIALRLMAYFGAALLLFALVGGLLFQSLYTHATIEAKKTEMLARAKELAGTLTDALAENSTGPRMGMGQGMGYGAFVRMVGLVETGVWVLDENMQFLSMGHMQSATLTYQDLPANAEAVVKAVFQGQTPFSEGFSDLLGTPTLTVGAPIYAGDTVAGALLLHDAVAGVTQAAALGTRVMLLSGAAALVAAAALGALLSRAFARPLTRMKAAALRLQQGDYGARTDVRRGDEIGSLAAAMDELGGRLADARDAAARQQAMRNEFLANVSHELRTPVTVLRGSLEALCDGVVTDEARTAEYHRRMLGETVALQRLVNDLMELARLQNTEFPIERMPLSLYDPLADALRAAEGLARVKGVRIVRALPDAPIPFEGDHGRLRQMFLTVLDNAVKFSPEGGEVRVALTEGCVSVCDQGPGIPLEEREAIFDRFHQVRSTQNRQGSGLGLAIARQIALRHGMRIEVHSAPEHGACFRFLWP